MDIKAWIIKKKTLKDYNLAADTYDDRYISEQSEKYMAVLDKIDLQYPSVILDLGCGTGLLIEKVKQRASYLVGIDFSRAMLAKARDKNKHFNNISFICGDSDFLPIREDVFNTVFSFTLLQNVPDPIRTLKEIIRVAKPQTLIVISALKKNYKKNEITNLIHKTNLKILESINHDFLNDYIYICENPLNKKLNHSNE